MHVVNAFLLSHFSRSEEHFVLSKDEVTITHTHSTKQKLTERPWIQLSKLSRQMRLVPASREKMHVQYTITLLPRYTITHML